MRVRQCDTPPNSISEDEIGEDRVDMDDEEIIYLEDIDEIGFDFDENEDYTDEEDTEIEPPEDLAAVVFNKHEGSVFCGDLHPDGQLAVTGGEDDKAFVWSTQTGELVMECAGHRDSVIFAAFSFDGAYLATADMAGLIKVWKTLTEKDQVWPIVFEFDVDDINFGLWHFGAKVLMAGALSHTYIFQIPMGSTKVLLGHNSKVECAKLFPDGVRLATGYEDGAVKIWDLKSSSVLHQVPACIHQLRVTAIDIHPDNSIVASISSDGKVILTTTHNGKVVAQLQAEAELETVTFVNDTQLGYFALGTLTGAVSIWDVARQMVRHQCVKPNDEESGVTKMIWVKENLITGCLDGCLRVYEGRSGEKGPTLTGHRSDILDLCYNAKENILLTTSDDGTARIFKYEEDKAND